MIEKDRRISLLFILRTQFVRKDTQVFTKVLLETLINPIHINWERGR